MLPWSRGELRIAGDEDFGAASIGVLDLEK